MCHSFPVTLCTVVMVLGVVGGGDGTLKFHSRFQIVNPELMAIHRHSGAFRHIGKMPDSAICHLDHQIVTRDGHDLTALDLGLNCGVPLLVVVFVCTCALMLKAKATQAAPTTSTSHVRAQLTLDLISFSP